jgi:crotonobetainyl-CoA:carnitine CoA-transferase CaiB-like acyl-CoA transferase
LVALGADVLKVEPPGGDPMRQYASLFESINAGKRSIELDLKDGHGQDEALELAAQADVLVEGFRPGVLTRLGLGVDTVRGANPALVYCSISGYGQDDPRAELPGHDVNYQAWAGALMPEGGAPRVSPLPIADLAGGMAAAFGICAAVVGRAATGEGAYLDVSMTDVLATWTGRVDSNDGTSAAASSRTGPVPGYGIFETAEGGQIALGVISEQHFWSNLCTELGRGDLAPLTFEDRSARGAELQDAVAAAIGGRGRDEMVAALTAAGVPVAPVLDRRGMVASAPFPAFPIRLPLRPVDRGAPGLDEHHGQGFASR